MLLIAAAAVCATSAGAEEVLVILKDQRALLGEADPATSDQHLWIHRSAAGILIRSGIAWSDIAEAQWAGRTVTLAELRRRLADSTPAEPVNLSAPSAPAGVERIDPPKPLASRVASLQVAATLANWDPDAAFDGLEIWIQPLDRYGRPLAVHGHVELFLHGQRGSLQPFTQYSVPPTEFPELARGSERICPDDFGPQGVAVRLEFDRFHPESALSLGPEGFLRVRLGVSGQGIFEASEPRVLLRPFGPFRDALQLQTGRRFFPDEWRQLRLP